MNILRILTVFALLMVALTYYAFKADMQTAGYIGLAIIGAAFCAIRYTSVQVDKGKLK